MKIAVSMSVRREARPPDVLRQNYIAFLEALELLPVPVPNTLTAPDAWLDALGIDGVVLSGGGDIEPARYGQADSGSLEVFPARDRTEWRLLDWAIVHNRPVLGICRGIQVLNVYFGGQLIQDLPSHGGRFTAHEGVATHPVRLTDPHLAAFLGTDTLDTNTFHHQGITAEQVAPSLQVFATSARDGLVEGVVHRQHPILGVQWHPERPTPSTPWDRKLFLRLFHEGAFWRTAGSSQ